MHVNFDIDNILNFLISCTTPVCIMNHLAVFVNIRRSTLRGSSSIFRDIKARDLPHNAKNLYSVARTNTQLFDTQNPFTIRKGIQSLLSLLARASTPLSLQDGFEHYQGITASESVRGQGLVQKGAKWSASIPQFEDTDC